MKNKIIITFVAIISLINLSSCKKDANINAPSEPVRVDAASLMANYFIKDEPADFTILVSSVHAAPLLDINEIEKTQIITQCFNDARTQVGDLQIGVHSIPFNVENSQYYLDLNPNLNDVSMLGAENELSISNNADYGGFNATEYFPTVANFTIDGLLDRNKYDLSQGFTINWTADNNNENENVIIIIEGENEDNQITSEMIINNEIDGSAKINSTMLSKFQEFSSLKIYLARGKDKNLKHNSKNIRLTVLNYAWSRVFLNP